MSKPYIPDGNIHRLPVQDIRQDREPEPFKDPGFWEWLGRLMQAGTKPTEGTLGPLDRKESDGATKDQI